MKPYELKAMLQDMWEVDIDHHGNVYIKTKANKRYWMQAPICNILEMAEELERLRRISPVSPADVMRESDE